MQNAPLQEGQLGAERGLLDGQVRKDAVLLLIDGRQPCHGLAVVDVHIHEVVQALPGRPGARL